jgi:hypothetical protein
MGAGPELPMTAGAGAVGVVGTAGAGGTHEAGGDLARISSRLDLDSNHCWILPANEQQQHTRAAMASESLDDAEMPAKSRTQQHVIISPTQLAPSFTL